MAILLHQSHSSILASNSILNEMIEGYATAFSDESEVQYYLFHLDEDAMLNEVYRERDETVRLSQLHEKDDTNRAGSDTRAADKPTAPGC